MLSGDHAVILDFPEMERFVLCFRNWPEDGSVNRNMSPGLYC